ncbi:MAG: PqiC family protein [Methylobacter sp.]
MTNQLSKRLLLLFGGVLLAGCMSPPTQFYVLEPLNTPPPSVTAAANKRQIGVGPVTIPALLERKQIVTRLPDNSVKVAEFHQWASPLKDNVAQVIAHNLAALQPDDLIRTYPWSAYGMVDYRFIIDIIRFDTDPERSVNLEANWAIMNEKNHTLISNGHSRIEHPLTDSSYPASVKALSNVLGEFSKELSQALDRIK